MLSILVNQTACERSERLKPNDGKLFFVFSLGILHLVNVPEYCFDFEIVT